MNQKTMLSNLCKNQKAKIIEYNKFMPQKTKRRLLELGFVKGAEIKILAESVFNEVLLISFFAGTMALRKDTAKHILVEI